MKKVFEVHQRWVEYGPPCGPGDYYDTFGSDLKATFDDIKDAKAYRQKLATESPNEEFEIWTVDVKPEPEKPKDVG